MGPRPFSRGHQERRYAYKGDDSRFNGAATFQSRTRLERRLKTSGGSTLQWGRDLSVADTIDYESGTTRYTLLQWGRDLSVADTRVLFASRGPMMVLQWGRDLSVADTVEVARLPPTLEGLQWGRDLSVADTRS